MDELIFMGHMLPAETTRNTVYYMTLHTVVKTTSQTKKLRVVFNASMNLTSGNSINNRPTAVASASHLGITSLHRAALYASYASKEVI